MNEKEKKAIKYLKTHNKLVFEPYLSIILNLVDKQQKEIEELKNNELDYTTIYISGVYDGKTKIENKIREKIKDLLDDLPF